MVARWLFAPEACARVVRSRAAVEAIAAAGDAAPCVYGVNTGFGALSETRISAHDVRQLQRNLVRSHSAGVGFDLAVAEVRGSEPVVYSGEDVRVEVPDAQGKPSGTMLVQHGVYATLVLGYLGIQLFGVDGPLSLPLDLDRAPERVLRIWPPQSTDVSWPPPVGYDDGNLAAFASRLTAPA
jgi:aromatic amino acid lyase